MFVCWNIHKNNRLEMELISFNVNNFWWHVTCLRHNPMHITQHVTRYVVTSHVSRVRFMHHILSFALCLLIHSGARHRERKIGFYSFYRSNSSLRLSRDLLFLLVKARKRGHRTPSCLRQIISRRNATTFSIFRDPK